MENNDYNDIGLFRFSIIAPAINQTHGFSTNEEFFRDASRKKYQFRGKEYQFSKSCIKTWYFSYKRDGYHSLEMKQRKDKTKSRKLSHDVISRIITLREQFPSITGTAIYKKLVQENYIKKESISLCTLLRFLKNNDLKANQVVTIERRMFEMEHVNDCWQSDTSDGPYIMVGKEKKRTKLIMFIDDKSRMIMGYDFFLNDTAVNMQSVFKKAIQTYGKPKRLFVDNGGPYDNKQLSMICASLGIELIHAKPYSPESKAKIERSFRTIKDGWMRCTNWNHFTCLEDVKNSLSSFLYNEYINKIHSSTNQTPNERWHNEYHLVSFLEHEQIENSFLHRVTRKVRKDRTIQVENDIYEVPFVYVGKTIEVRYIPNDREEVYLFRDEKKCETCKKVDKVANSKVKRKNNVDFTKVMNDERDVIEEK